MSSCPLISIMHRLTAVGFIFTATSLRVFGINSKCCDPSRQLVEQTATAHRAEQAVSSESQLLFSFTTLDYTIIYMTCLSAQSPFSKIRHTAHVFFQTNSCNRLSVSFITQTCCLQTSSVEASHLSLSLCSTWCLIPSLSWVGNTGSMKSLLRSTCLLLSTSIWTLSPCSSSCCSSSVSAARMCVMCPRYSFVLLSCVRVKVIMTFTMLCVCVLNFYIALAFISTYN